MLSLVTIISIYREGGILKRLRATPIRPQTILTAHVVAKLVFTSATLILLALAGRRVIPPGQEVPLVRFSAALLFTTVSLLSIGFVIASVVPTARFAQPMATLILYPMIAISGLFVPVEALPAGVQAVSRVAAVHLRGVAPQRRMAARALVRARRRHRRVDRDLHRLHGAVGADFPVGVRATLSRVALPACPARPACPACRC